MQNSSSPCCLDHLVGGRTLCASFGMNNVLTGKMLYLMLLQKRVAKAGNGATCTCLTRASSVSPLSGAQRGNLFAQAVLLCEDTLRKIIRCRSCSVFCEILRCELAKAEASKKI